MISPDHGLFWELVGLRSPAGGPSVGSLAGNRRLEGRQPLLCGELTNMGAVRGIEGDQLTEMSAKFPRLIGDVRHCVLGISGEIAGMTPTRRRNVLTGGTR